MLPVRDFGRDRQGQFRASDQGAGPYDQQARGHQDYQEQEAVPSPGAGRGPHPGPPQEKGQRWHPQRDTHARVLLLPEPPVHQLRTHEVNKNYLQI